MVSEGGHVIHPANHHALLRAGFRVRSVPSSHGEIKVYDAKGEPNGPTLVLVHGVSGRASNFARVAIPLLPRCGRIVIPDLLGHGDSFVPQDGLRVPAIAESLITTLDDIVPEPMVIAGNSMGALIAGLFVAERAWRVRGLFLSNPGGAPVDDEVFYSVVDLLTPTNYAEALRLAEAGSSYRSRFILHLGALRILFNLGQPHIRDFLLTASPEESLSTEQVSRLAMPILLVTGQDDGVIPDQTIAWYRAHLPPHAEIEEVALFGHAPMSERPRVLTQYIRDFLAQLDASSEQRGLAAAS
jgi:pimeloyl-ACP methyl ester carboxylesterase